MKRIFTLLLLIAFFISGNLNAQQDIKEVKKTNKSSDLSNLKWEEETHVIHCSEFHVTKPLIEIAAEHPIVENKTYPYFSYPDQKNRPVQTFKYSVEKDGPKYGCDMSKVQTSFGKTPGKAPIQNWAGQTASGFRPDDPTGAAGPNHYIQMINSTTYRIYNKTGGTLATGTLGDLWSPATGNSGDPIVLYDKAADRWFMSQFGTQTDKKIYIAISQTADPTGSWYTYTFTSPAFPDYLKFSAWQDGYYMTSNQAQKVFAFNRTKMLAGDPTAEAVYKSFSPPQSGFFVPLPGDASDGTMPGAGTPCPIFCYQDDAWSGVSNDGVNIYESAVTWGGTPSMTVTSKASLPTIAFDGSYDASWNDISQPGTTQKLDGIGGAMMFRAQWKPWSGYNTAVLSWAVKISASQRGIFWCELRQNTTTTNWSIYQQGIYAPGTDSYWMSSIGMDDAGNIGLGYAKASTSTYMSVCYTGRMSCDPLGTMTAAEVVAKAGLSSQTTTNRVGDYAHLCLDPDGSTFWYTGEYMASGGNEGTQIFSFQVPGSCAAPVVSNVTPTSLFEDRGKQLTITGTDLSGCTFDIGGISGSVVSNDGSTAVVTFPAGDYTNGTLTVTNTSGTDNSHSVTVNTRNTIPVVSGAGATSDNHPTIQSAFDGLSAWYGATAFNAGDLAGTKTIEVSAATYTEGVTLNSSLNPTAANPLIIQPATGAAVIVDATGNNYGFDLNTVNYVTLKGFTVHDADIANIYLQGDNCEVYLNKLYNAGNSGIKLETGATNNIHNNLTYSNGLYGIHVLSSNNNTIKNNTCNDNGSNIPGGTIYLMDESFDPTPSGWTRYTKSGSGGWNFYSSVGVGGTNAAAVDDPDVFEGWMTHPAITIPAGVTSIDIEYEHRTDWSTAYNTLWRLEKSTAPGNQDADWTTIQTWNGSASHPTSYTTVNESTTVTPGSDIYIGWYCENNNLDGIRIDNVKISYTSAPVTTGAGLYVESGTGTTVENNIFVAKSGNDSFYSLKTEAGITVSSDYNTYYTTNTNLFDYNGTQDNSGPMGANDLTSDPQFVGGGDYHIFSTNDSYHAGEWPPLTATAGAWTNDASNSTALDAGNPADSYSNEPQSGNRINQGCYGNTVQASKTTSAVTYTWDGSTDNNWFDATNWTPAQVPTVSDNVTIANVTNQPTINNGIGNIAQCNNITIDNGASLTIDPNGYMTVSGAITNNGGNAGLVINSDATGTGSLIQNTSGGVDATVKCYLASSSRQWHMVSSPITAAPFTVFPSTSNLYYYDESTADYWTGTTYGSSSVSGWTAPAGNMTVGKGYVFNYFASTLTYTGQLNDNSSSAAIAVPYNNHGANDPDGNSWNNSDGWSLIGNPYTSAIDWDDASVAHAAANLNDAVYTYEDGTLHNYTSYVGGVGTNGGTRYIPAMQGFFVKSDNTETGGTLNIGAAARVHNTQSYWKGNTPNNFIRLQIAGNGYTDETVIRLNSNATYDSDNGLDAYKLFTWDVNVPQIYTVTGNGNTEFSINTVPDFAQGTIEIPLKVAQTGDNYKIGITEFNFSDVSVYLKDNLKNITTEIGLNDVFELNTDASDNDNRFELVFEKSTSGILLAENTSVTIYPNPNRGQFWLSVDNKTSKYNVKIENVTGQVIFNNKFFGNTTKMINLSNQTSGIYFVTIQFSDNSAITKKIVIE